MNEYNYVHSNLGKHVLLLPAFITKSQGHTFLHPPIASVRTMLL